MHQAWPQAWVSIDIGNVVANAKILHAVAEERGKVDIQLLVMVKADAYGCGAQEVARALSNSFGPVWGYGVATLDEGIVLRHYVHDPILVLTPAVPANLDTYAHWKLRAVIDDPAVAMVWHKGLPFHIEIDTGLNRNGIHWKDKRKLAVCAAQHCDGAFTHLAAADCNHGITTHQASYFELALEHLKPLPHYLHIANSAGVWRAPALRECNLVRPGSFLYGGRPSPEIPKPWPVMSVNARVVSVHEAEGGEWVGYYNHAPYLQQRVRIAVLGIGYADGVPQRLGRRRDHLHDPEQGYVLLHGKRQPILSVAQDFTIIAVATEGHEETTTGHHATLLGKQGQEEITVNEFATWGGTVVDDVLTRFGTSRLKRTFNPTRQHFKEDVS